MTDKTNTAGGAPNNQTGPEVGDASQNAEVHCDQCGYDLRGQPVDGRCPECGLAVAMSVRTDAELDLRRLISALFRLSALYLIAYTLVRGYWIYAQFGSYFSNVATFGSGGVRAWKHVVVLTAAVAVFVGVVAVLWFAAGRLTEWVLGDEATQVRLPLPRKSVIVSVGAFVLGLYLVMTGIEAAVQELVRHWHAVFPNPWRYVGSSVQIVIGVIFVVGPGGFRRLFEWSRTAGT